jgi:outer membrane protein assembly factor BamA
MKTTLKLCFGFLLFWAPQMYSQQSDDSLKAPPTKEKIKKGWNIGFLPVIGYSSDIGLQYGALANIYDYGDGSTYPKYDHSLYFEVSRTNKGGGINQFFYDSEKLLHGLRVTADLTYLTEKALDFYGFNGYQAVYNPLWEDDSQDSTIYKTRMFYRHERKLLRIGVDLQGKFSNQKIKWLAGLAFLKTETAPVDIDQLNKGLSDSKKLPDVPGLYDNYVSWGVLSPEEIKGSNTVLRLGLIYDTRDNEPNPMKGIWSEVIFAMAPAFLGDGDFGFIKIAAAHRQYFTLIKNDLSFAYRVAYQGTIAGKVPFYMQPYMINSFAQTTTIDGLGGARNLRGIMRNRVVGDGMAYGNTEFRWKFYRFSLIRQNFYLALNAFADAGMVVQNIPVDKSGIPEKVDQSQYFSDGPEKLHVCVGGGLRVVMNQNFVISADYGAALDKRDGDTGLYIGFGFLF